MANINKIHLPWVEKYRPLTLKNIESHTHILNTIENYINSGNIPHMLYYGPPGTGKTTTILACARQLYGNDDFRIMTLELNASDDRGINMVRDRIQAFASTYSLGLKHKKKLIILDEADAMTTEAQHALQKIMDTHSINCQFCIICNYISKIVPEILSRCTRFRFPPLPEKIVTKFIKNIVISEKLTINKSGIQTIMEISRGDMRQVLNIIQSCSASSQPMTEESICEILSKPSITVIGNIVNKLLSMSIRDRYLYIKSYLHETGISVFDLITDIGNYILDHPKIPIKNLARTIRKLSEIEIRSFSDSNQDLQVGALVSCFN